MYKVDLFLGTTRELTNFQFDYYSRIAASCSVSIDGRMFIFGGSDSYSNQILEVGYCDLRRIGQLPFLGVNLARESK